MTRTEAELLKLRLSWAILENRWKYYIGRYNSKKVKTISDESYDKIESNYIKICKALKTEPYSTEMVGFNVRLRGSTKMVHIKMCAEYGIDPNDYSLGG
jgi:hypothetical protein